MGRKGKRRRRPSARPTGAEPARATAPALDRGPAPPVPGRPEATKPRRGESGAREERTRPRGLFGGRGLPSPYPGLGRSLERGFVPIGRSWQILAAAFLGVLAFWGLMVGLGFGSPPTLLAVSMSLPPISVLSDALLLSGQGGGAVAGLGLVVAAEALRALFVTAIALAVVQVLRDGRVDPRAVLLRLPRAGLPIFAILAAEVGITLALFVLGQGLLGGQGAVLLAWGLGLYFLVFAPVVVAAEGVNAAEALRRAFRAARLPGPRHLSLVMLYVVAVFFSAVATQTLLAPATPTLRTWVQTLAFTFVHLGFLGAFAFRWLEVREEVPAGPRKRERRP